MYKLARSYKIDMHLRGHNTNLLVTLVNNKTVYILFSLLFTSDIYRCVA